MFTGKTVGVLSLIAQCGAVCFWLYGTGRSFQHVAGDYDPSFGLFSLFMACATAYAIYAQFKSANENARFLAWLVANAEKIRNNHSVYYRSQRISMDTILVRHHLVFSALIISSRTQTRWLIKGKEPRFWHAVAACLYTCFYGWWGFPFGMYWTPLALIKNLRGSTCVQVKTLLQPAPAKPTGFGERFEKNFSKRLQSGFFIDEVPAGILPAETVGKV